ncbi:uncharacterized protein N7506_011080 [Penicillium brevicompactum]|uniref:uncharacterized protein n=1 Tax=Penicillium brevicompactum TaxID=5074 RepID=UPI0025422A56|nr:uncharacterized protein N7506_011080 [Penicillium brevicompactum]KAJ5321950.1 hypothetical protein N7506_011080 [Penicillium brevicompactum]
MESRYQIQNPDSTPVLPKKGKKACTQCRQQKSKCDVWRDETVPCSRCKKHGYECTIDDGFTREHKRRRLNELEREKEQLRQQLQISRHRPSDHPAIDAAPATAGIGVPSGFNSNVGSEVSQKLASLPEHELSLTDSASGTTTQGSETTRSRSLRGVTVTGEEIDDLYQMFFRHYASFLPILDAQIKPNAYYAQSPFLFWAVIGVCSRSYPRNPTLQTALAQGVTEMAFLSVLSTCAPWFTIQGLLLLLTWPFPKENRPDVTFPLSGMLLHVAMQNGFHIPMSSHEFSRVKIPAPSEIDMIRRSELWAQCVLVYQRSCVIKGQSPRNIVSLAQDPMQRQMLFNMIAPDLAQKLRCQELVGSCSEAVLENGVRAMSLDQELSLDKALRSFEDQVDEIELQTIADDERYHLLLCRMAIQSFHFYKTRTVVSSGCLARLIATACGLVDYIQTLADRMGFISMAPVQVGFGLLLASMSLLRILKSKAAVAGLDANRARVSFFMAINLAKQMSTDRTDTAAKTITVLNQLWNSSKAFRKPDGSEYTSLRIRSRLILSPILDAVWWWRDEFDPHTRAIVRGTESTDVGGASRATNMPGGNMGHSIGGADQTREPLGSVFHNMGPPPQEEFMMDEDFFSKFEWAISEEDFLSLGAFPTDWSSTNNIP